MKRVTQMLQVLRFEYWGSESVITINASMELSGQYRERKKVKTRKPRPPDDSLSHYSDCVYLASGIRCDHLCLDRHPTMATKPLSLFAWWIPICCCDRWQLFCQICALGHIDSAGLSHRRGVRHLIQDMGYFEELESGAKSAQVSFVVTGVLSVLAGVLVW